MIGIVTVWILSRHNHKVQILPTVDQLVDLTASHGAVDAPLLGVGAIDEISWIGDILLIGRILEPKFLLLHAASGELWDSPVVGLSCIGGLNLLLVR